MILHVMKQLRIQKALNLLSTQNKTRNNPINSNYRYDLLFLLTISILCFISNSFVVYVIPAINYALFFSISFFEIFTLFFISILFSKCKRIFYIFQILTISILLILILIESFTALNFSLVFCQRVIDIISETNFVESFGFLKSYLNLSSIIISIIILTFLFTFIRLSLKQKHLIVLSKKQIKIFLITYVLTFSYLIPYIYGYIRYHDGQGLPQYTSITRLFHSYYLHYLESKRINLLIDLSSNCHPISNRFEESIIVVIIGESHSKYHSQLYGYPINNEPLLTSRLQNGELVLFTNVVSISDHTHGAISSIMSLSNSSKDDFFSQHLFPVVLKESGWNTIMLDNQYILNASESSFMTNEELSRKMFSQRNTKRFATDEDMIDNHQFQTQNRQLYVIHLLGQHYDYETNCPKSFKKFSSLVYKNSDKTDNQKKTLAAYDNITLYNDYIINKIIDIFEDKNAIVIYFSDHGEEVCDNDEYFGHGNAAFNKNRFKYQIEVPFFIWMSKEYINYHKDIAKAIHEKSNCKYLTDDISHTLLDLAGVRIDGFDETRSLLSSKFKERTRIVLGSINYDKVEQE